jgi:colanic acid biosynthesis glycosyl transferase WcaI
MTAGLNIQLWSYNYAPEPTGIAPVSTTWACAMRDRGHSIEVIAAHPHYPEPSWGRSFRPYREHRNGIHVLRLPLWFGRSNPMARIRQELSFAAVQTVTLPTVRCPDVMVVVSPSFPALIPAMLRANRSRIPWVLWLQDILPDGAATTGLIGDGRAARAARLLERRAYARASSIVVISESFERNLLAKGVPAEKLHRVYNPATLTPSTNGSQRNGDGRALRLLVMGNIGHSQGLDELVRMFEQIDDPAATLVITGSGMAEDEVRAQIRSDRVQMLGVVDDARLDHELSLATAGIVSQRSDILEFNVPSKLMNYMMRGLPVIALARKKAEVSRIVEAANAGWVVSDRAGLAAAFEALRDDDGRHRAGAAAADFAQSRFSVERFAEGFERAILAAVSN